MGKVKRNASKARTEPVKLRECPFCGETELEPVQVAMEYNCEDWNWAMRCNYCGAFGPQCGMRQQTAEAWNKRAAAKLPG